MADIKISQGFKCEFVDSVPEDFYCKKCSLVARGLVMTDCCGESYCHSCIADSLPQGQSCPACGELDFTIFHQKKYHKRIDALKVNCTMKEKGCGWSGTLDKLDTHLDPDLGNCQYVDTKCPLHCLLTVPKNKVDQHVAQECTKRPHVCQHCGFKATYEEVMDTHMPECKYVPLVCPNRCGVTFERDFMEDHMKMCRLEEISCEFRNVGCDGSFSREDEDKHTKENSHKHLTLTASLAAHNKEQLLHKLLEQEEKHKEMEAEMRERLQQQEKTTEQQEKMIKLLENKFTTMEKEHKQEVAMLRQTMEKQNKDLQDARHKLEEQEINTKKWLKTEQLQNKENIKVEEEKTSRIFEIQARKIEDLQDQHEKTISTVKEMKLVTEQQAARTEDKLGAISRLLGIECKFVMKNFTQEKQRDKPGEWKSPAMYTHVAGYKFCIGVDANGRGAGRGKCVNVELWAVPGEYDNQLKWPAEVTITIELVNQQGGKNAEFTETSDWTKPIKSKRICSIGRLWLLSSKILTVFVLHFELNQFLLNDTLQFNILLIEISRL